MTDRQFVLGLCATCAAITVAPAAIGMAMTEQSQQPQQSIASPAAAEYVPPAATAPTFEVANSHVRNNLNAADGMFQHGMDGCTSVSIAIQAATNPSIFGPTSASDRAEVARYAQRCNLRF